MALAALDAKAAGTDSFGLTNYNKLKANSDYLVVAGANLASAATIVSTSEFHIVTGTVTIDNLSPVGPVAGQQIRLLFQSALTVRNNGGGTGNIRTLNGLDRAVAANEIVIFVYDGTVWRESTLSNARRLYGKITAKIVNTTVAATDLLNGEIAIAAGVMGANGVLRLTAWGDWLQNSGATVASPRFQVVFGGTTLLDTGISGTGLTGAVRNSWRIVVEIENLGAANAQMTHIDLRLMINGASTQVQNTFTTGEGILTSLVAAGQLAFGEGVNPSTAVNTALAQALLLNVINASASASYETKLLGALLEVV